MARDHHEFLSIWLLAICVVFIASMPVYDSPAIVFLNHYILGLSCSYCYMRQLVITASLEREVLELFLNACLAQLGLFNFFDLLYVLKWSILIFLFHVNCVNVRLERWQHASLFKGLPIEIIEPWMLFQSGCTSQVAQSVLRLYLYTSIYVFSVWGH